MATAILLPAPELQFCDADGNPYAGGSVATYVPGTTTPKATWVDPGEAALNTNPVILDAAGRCIIYGDGAYRIILRDAAGNLIYDQLSDTIISAAMHPVVSAPTIADAQVLLGITGFATASDLASAISTEQTARIAADNAEIAARTAGDANLQSQIDAINATIAGLPGPTAVPSVQHARDVTDGDGHKRVTFPIAFSAEPAVVALEQGASYDLISATITADATGFDIWLAFPLTSGITPAGARSFYWVAAGPH